eukprot:1417432-Prymnesium_polylepis.1
MSETVKIRCKHADPRSSLSSFPESTSMSSSHAQSSSSSSHASTRGCWGGQGGRLPAAQARVPVPLLRQQHEPLLTRLLVKLRVSVPRPQQRARRQDRLRPLALLVGEPISHAPHHARRPDIDSRAAVLLELYGQHTSSRLPTRAVLNGGGCSGCCASTESETPAASRAARAA